MPQKREAAFMVRHYAGKVKYQVCLKSSINYNIILSKLDDLIENTSQGISSTQVYSYSSLLATKRLQISSFFFFSVGFPKQLLHICFSRTIVEAIDFQFAA